MKLNLILFCTLIIFALAKVNAHHQYRQSYLLLEQEKRLTVELKDEKTKLQIEESSKSGNARIKQISKNQLGMKLPNKFQKRVISR